MNRNVLLTIPINDMNVQFYKRACYSVLKTIAVINALNLCFIMVLLHFIFCVIRGVRSSQFHFCRVVPRVETNTFYKIDISLRCIFFLDLSVCMFNVSSPYSKIIYT